MVQAIINIEEKANQTLNIIKAKYNLKDKSQAINKMAQQYMEDLLEPQLRPEYIKKMLKIQKEKSIKYTSLDELKKSIENVQNRS